MKADAATAILIIVGLVMLLKFLLVLLDWRERHLIFKMRMAKKKNQYLRGYMDARIFLRGEKCPHKRIEKATERSLRVNISPYNLGWLNAFYGDGTDHTFTTYEETLTKADGGAE